VYNSSLNPLPHPKIQGEKMSAFALALANPVVAGISFLLLIVALHKVLTIKFESTIIPPNPNDEKIFRYKKNFLWFAVIVCGILPVINFLLIFG